jgi:hypothetical protein
MAVAPEIDSRFRPNEPNKTNPTAPGPDHIDTLVTDFLQELTGLSAEIEPVQQPKAESEEPTENFPVFEMEQAQKNTPPEPLVYKEEVFSEPELDLVAIDSEINATLVELERIKSAVLPIAAHQDSTPQPLSPPVRSPKQPVVASASQMTVKNPAARRIRKTEEPEWSRLEIFRTEIASSRSSRRRRTFYFALAAAVLLGILIFWLFLESDKILQLIGGTTFEGKKMAFIHSDISLSMSAVTFSLGRG